MPQAVALGIIAGYADAVGYLRFKAFAGMMTGNTVLMGLALFGRAELQPWIYASLLALFFVAAVATYLLLPHVPPVVLLAGEALLILVSDAVSAQWAVSFLVIAMGMQNQVAARFGVPLNTTFITGDILRFAEGLAGRLSLAAVQPSSVHFAIFGLVWFGYALGAALGAAAFKLVAWPLVVPALLLGFVYWRARPAR